MDALRANGGVAVEGPALMPWGQALVYAATSAGAMAIDNCITLIDQHATVPLIANTPVPPSKIGGKSR